MKSQSRIFAILAIAGLSAVPFVVQASGPQQDDAKASGTTQAQATLPPPQFIAAGEDHAKQLLLLMDTDMNGKVSKAEFMAYMEAEFNRLDINHDGQLDVKELTAPKMRSVAGGHK